MFRSFIAILAFFLTTGLAVRAQDSAAGDLTIDAPVIFKSFAGARAAAGYMTITNGGSQPDRLIGVSVAGPMAMIHESREEDGVMRMIHLDSVEIPAGETVAFRPGGLHLMIMGLQPDDLPVGDTLDAVLIFEHAGDVAIAFSVVERPTNGATQ